MSDNDKSVVAKAEKEMSKMCTAKEITEELSVVANCYSGKEDMLLPAPFVIATLGKLTLIANKGSDFTLTEPADGFHFIRWRSFRASLFEVTGKAQNAFLLADKNMKTIELLCKDITENFREATRILIKLSDEELQAFLDIPLKQIYEATKTCEEKAEETEKAYKEVLDMTLELQAATINKDKETADDLVRIKKAKEALNLAQAMAKERRNENSSRCKKMEESVKEAQSMFKDSLTNSDKMVIGMAAGEYLSSLVTSTVVPLVHSKYGVPFGYQQNQQMPSLPTSENQQDDFEHISRKQEKEAAKQCAYTKAGFILDQCTKLANLISKNEDGSELITDESINEQEDVQCWHSYREMKRELAKYQMYESKRIQSLIDVCAKGFQICEKMKKLRREPEKVNQNEVIKDIKQNEKKAREMSELARKKLHVPGMAPPPRCVKPNCEHDVKITQMHAALKQAHFKVNQTMEYYKETMKELNTATAERTELAKEFAERAEKLQTLSIEEVDYKRIRECLGQGLEALAMLRDRWLRLCEFFQTMSTLISHSMATKSNTFLEFAQMQKKLAIEGKITDQGTKVIRELIYNQAFGAVKISVTVQHLAEAYANISQRYLMPQVAALNTLVTTGRNFRAITHDEQQRAEQLNLELREAGERLTAERERAEEGIREEIKNSAEKAQTAVLTRQQQLEKIMADLPKLALEDQEELDEVMAAGYAEAEYDSDLEDAAL